tara:strand:- start:23 stop:853 length:831 start_codon:yes stop_codon:yes gene_type:complete
MKSTDITFVIVTFNSEKIIEDCLNSLPNESKKIIVENSGNENLKINLEKNFTNLKCYIMKENLGYGRANNFGISLAETDYIFILNPDVKFSNKTMNKLLDVLKDELFTIAAPVDKNEVKEFNFNNRNLIEVEFVRGFAMLLNKKNFLKGFFDENIFLYLEEIDLCKRVKDEKGRIILINAELTHEVGFSHGKRDDFEMEKSRNWHWMWSKFYYSKKHKGYIHGFINTLPNFISAIAKFIFYSLINEKKKDIYKMRILGLLNSYLQKSSFYRPYKNN